MVFFQSPPGNHPVKITLNESIPMDRRQQVELLVSTCARSTQIVWRASRYPRFVIFVEPGPGDEPDQENSSIFESPRAETSSLASVTAMLEDHIKSCLAVAEPRP